MGTDEICRHSIRAGSKPSSPVRSGRCDSPGVSSTADEGLQPVCRVTGPPGGGRADPRGGVETLLARPGKSRDCQASVRMRHQRPFLPPRACCPKAFSSLCLVPGCQAHLGALGSAKRSRLTAPPAARDLLLPGKPRFAQLLMDLARCSGHELGGFSAGRLQLRVSRQALAVRRSRV